MDTFEPLRYQNSKEGQARQQEIQWMRGKSVGNTEGYKRAQAEFIGTRMKLVDAGVALAQANAQLTQALTHLLNKHA